MINKEILTAYMNSNNCNYRETALAMGTTKQRVNYYMKKFGLSVVKKIAEK